jgi:hypothetical protein
MSEPVTALCLYRVRTGREGEFTALLRRHWPTLRELGLVSADPARHWQGAEHEGAPLFVEMFEWADESAAGAAHEHPEVMAIWEPMDELTEARGGKPNMEFPHVRALALLGPA